MYSDKKRSRLPWIAAGILVVLVIVGGLLFFFFGSQEDVKTESTAAVKAAVQRTAIQCYVVEGMYPPNLAYLEQNYGLQVNQKDFVVIYDAFASNLPPSIQVTVRNQGN